MQKKESIIEFPQAQEPNFKMIDVSRKRPTRRRAVAAGTLYMNEKAYLANKNGTLPKGNALALAEAAGITGAKKTPDMIPMCHTLPLDQVTIHVELNDADHSVTIYCQAAAHAKTGVEMEALAGVNNALLTLWDLTKGIDPALRMGKMKLLAKTGGKSGVWLNPDGVPEWLAQQLPQACCLEGKKVALLVMSDRASQGDYEDKTGPLLKKTFATTQAEISDFEIIPDDEKTISETILNICHNNTPDLMIAAGGTGPGPRDVTPEVLEKISDRMLNGLGDLLRQESLHYVDTAWLSRMTAAMVGPTLVIAFPGSPKAVKECWDIIEPFLAVTLERIAKQGFK